MHCIRLFVLAALALSANSYAADRASDKTTSKKAQIEADTLSGDEKTVRAKGRVRACFDSYILRAEVLEYRAQDGFMHAPDKFELYRDDGDQLLSGDSFRYWHDNQLGEIDNAQAVIGEQKLYARSKTAHLREKHISAQDVQVTSCKPDSVGWEIRADSVQIENEIITIDDAWLKVGRVPLFYIPYFVINTNDEKRSGLLPPDARFSNAEGIYLAQPYYFNLADNYDATFTPQLFTEQGILLNGEFRYLTKQQQGEINIDWLPSGNDRGRQYIQHQWTGRDWQIKVDADNVSDSQYFNDFSDDNKLLAARNLPRRVSGSYIYNNWQAAATAETFQTLDFNGDLPHDRLPWAQLQYQNIYHDYVGRSEWDYTRFVANRAAQPSGGRWLWRATLWRRFDVGGVEVFPEIGWHAAKYSGESEGAFFTPYTRLRVESGGYSLPGISNGSYDLLAVYAYAPKTRQENIPLFDTALRELTLGGIYDWNRFSGGDRASDANVAAYGISFRLWDDKNNEQAIIEFAQRYYLRRPRLTIVEERNPPERGFSNFLASWQAKIDRRWKTEGDIEWNPERGSSERFYADLRADFGKRRLLRIGALIDEEESLLLGSGLPLGKRVDFSFFARYLLNTDKITDAEAAIAVRAECGCWEVFFKFQNILTSDSKNKISYSVGLQLTGLGTLGSNSYKNIIDNIK